MVKWVLKTKHEQDGSIRYKARLVVRKFNQIPGVDYNESFSPVATETSIYALIGFALLAGVSDFMERCVR